MFPKNTVYILIITCPVLLCIDNDETCDIVDYQKKFEILNTFEQDSRSEDVSVQFQYYGQCKYGQNCCVSMVKHVKSVFSALTMASYYVTCKTLFCFRFHNKTQNIFIIFHRNEQSPFKYRHCPIDSPLSIFSTLDRLNVQM